MPSPILRFRLPDEVKAKLEALSAASGFSVSELVRACIDRAYPYVEHKVSSQNSTPQTSNDTQSPADV